MTAKYPDILQLMPELLSPLMMDDNGEETGVQSFIMDAEIVAIEPHTKALLTFQTLANRARKDVNIHEVKVKVGIFAFDLMYLNGRVSENAGRERLVCGLAKNHLDADSDKQVLQGEATFAQNAVPASGA